MPSNVDCTARTAPAIMLLEAMVRESKIAELDKKFGLPAVPLRNEFVRVELKINGVEVDFVKTAQEMWERLESQHEADVLEKAKELVGRTRLDKVHQLMERFEWEIEQELLKLVDGA